MAAPPDRGGRSRRLADVQVDDERPMVGDSRVDRPRRTGRPDRPVAEDVVELLRRMADRDTSGPSPRVEPGHARCARSRSRFRSPSRTTGARQRADLARQVRELADRVTGDERQVGRDDREVAARGLDGRDEGGSRLVAHQGRPTAARPSHGYATTTQRQVEHVPRAHGEAAQQRDPVGGRRRLPVAARGGPDARLAVQHGREPVVRRAHRLGGDQRSGRRRANAAGPGRPPAGRARRRRGHAPPARTGRRPPDRRRATARAGC